MRLLITNAVNYVKPSGFDNSIISFYQSDRCFTVIDLFLKLFFNFFEILYEYTLTRVSSHLQFNPRKINMWLVRFLSSSIGKKFLMACTGSILLLFLLAHAAGNAAILFSSKAFQTYADTLHSLPVVVFIFGFGLLIILLAHVLIGVSLYLQNLKNSSSRYEVSTRVVKNTLASSTMPYSGLCILLFIIVHVFGFGFSASELKISVLVQELLSNFYYGVFYLFSFCALALHLSHGFWSMLQTFGFNHPRYNSAIIKMTFVIPGFFLVFFGGIVLYFMTGIGSNY